MPDIRVGDANVYYEIHGVGFPLLMINGFGSSTEMWSPFWKGLAGRLQVILFDNRGVGRTTAPEGPFSIRTMAEDASGLLRALGFGNAAVYGASMGGMIAQELVLGHPAEVRALILGMTSCGGPHSVPISAETMQRMRSSVQALPGMGLPGTVRSAVSLTGSPEYLRMVYSPEFLRDHEAELLDEGRKVRYPTSLMGYRHQQEAVMAFDTYDRLPEIRVPTLVMAGSADMLIPPENARILASRIPAARLRIFEGAGHGFTRERMTEATRDMLDFLEAVGVPLEGAMGTDPPRPSAPIPT